MLATHPNGPEHGTPSGIRTRDLHLERVTSWAARLWGQLCEACGRLDEPANTISSHDRASQNDTSSCLAATSRILPAQCSKMIVNAELNLLKCQTPAPLRDGCGSLPVTARACS